MAVQHFFSYSKPPCKPCSSTRPSEALELVLIGPLSPPLQPISKNHSSLSFLSLSSDLRLRLPAEDHDRAKDKVVADIDGPVGAVDVAPRALAVGAGEGLEGALFVVGRHLPAPAALREAVAEEAAVVAHGVGGAGRVAVRDDGPGAGGADGEGEEGEEDGGGDGDGGDVGMEGGFWELHFRRRGSEIGLRLMVRVRVL